MRKLRNGDRLQPRAVESIQGESVQIPDIHRITHIQFRRFVGCPICHLHLKSFEARHSELVAAGIREVAVFHSSRESMQEYGASASFPLIGDPTRSLYRVFGVEKSVISILHPGAWGAALKGIITIGPSLPPAGDTPWGLPGDFLIDPDGIVLAVKYGKHAYDQWSVDEVLSLADGRDHLTSLPPAEVAPP